MSRYTVARVRKEESADKTHRHIAGVCTDANVYYSRKEVVDSLDRGDTWKTSADGYTAIVEEINYCPRSGCLATPYIRTKPDSTTKDNLENLDEC